MALEVHTPRERSSPQPEAELAPLVPGLTEAAFASATWGIAVADADGHFLRVNDAFAAVFGCTPSALLGRGFWEITHPDVPATDQLQLRGLQRGTLEHVELERHHVRHDGRSSWIAVAVTPIRDTLGDLSAYVSTVHDITTRIVAEEGARASTARMERLQRITAAFAQPLARAQVAALFIEEVLPAVGADGGSVSLLDPSGETLVLEAHTGLPEDAVARWRHLPVRRQTPTVDATRDEQPVLLPTIEAWMTRYPATTIEEVRSSGFEGFAAIPFVVDGRALGAAGVNFRAARTLSVDEVDFLLTATRQAAQALERARLYDELCAARDAAEEANRAKMEFLSRMSHELRTPLNAIAGYVELLELELRGPLSADQRHDLARVRQNQIHLLSVIDSLLQFARVETGHLRFDREPLLVVDLFASADALVASLARAKGVALTFADPAALTVVADADKVRQILVNLLGNAVKFTHAGGAIVVDAAAEGGCVTLQVRDDGPGVPPAMREAIFEPFRQLAPATAVVPAGSVGLGLAISRELARAMGGDLWLADAPGGGASFAVRLPRAS